MANQQLIKGARFAAGPIVPIGSVAAAGFEKGQKRVQDIQRREFEKRKLEAENFERKRNEINKTLLAFRNNAPKIKVNAELAKGFWRDQLNLGAVTAKKNSAELENAIRSGRIEQYDALKLQDKNKEFLESLQKKSDDFVALVGAAEAIDANLSSTVSSETMGYVDGILNGNKEIINEISKKFDIEIDDMLSPNTFKEIGYVAADTEGINALFNTTQKAAQSAAQKGAGKDGYMDSVKQGLAQLNLSDEQYVSAAFDFLGKEAPGYTSPFESYINQNPNIKAGIESKNISAIKDENNSGSNIDEIKEFVNTAMLKAAEDSYESFKSDYADKFDKGISADIDKPDKKEVSRKEQLDFAMPLIEQVEIPRKTNGNADIDSVTFVKELARLNLAVDKSGAYSTATGEVIAVKSNVTNKTLNVTSDMLDSDIKNILMLLSGATPEEANNAYPLRREGPLPLTKPQLP